MATHTCGTNANNSLTCVAWSPSAQVLSPADAQTINKGILSDGTTHNSEAALRAHGGFDAATGTVYFPNNRGFCKLAPGDVVAIDTTSNVGWPIVISKNAINNGPWTFT